MWSHLETVLTHNPIIKDKMNCDPVLPRYLCFTDFLDDQKILNAKALGIVNPIVRKHSDIFELDFRFPGNPNKTNLSDTLNTSEIFEVEDDFSHVRTSEILSTITALISEERYWECHNLLEELWKRHSGEKKKLLHEIIGIVVSQIKVQMGQWEVGKVVYERSFRELNSSDGDKMVKQLPHDFAYPLKFNLEILNSILEP